MEEIFTAIVIKAEPNGENDKRITLITPFGVKSALIKGVRRPSARLRAAAMPFAFYQYTAVKKGNSYVITGASQIEDLFDISLYPHKLTAGAIILEAAFIALKNESPMQFVFMLKRLKDIIYSPDNTNLAFSYLSAIRFIQYIIHDAGYGYDYIHIAGEIDTPIKLLSALHFTDSDKNAQIQADELLIIKTLIKIINNFENKFETQIASKKLIIAN